MRNIDVEIERTFENARVLNKIRRSSQSKYYWATAPMIEAFDEDVVRSISGKDVLEIGCSDGMKAGLYAKASRRFLGIDLSDEGIQVARDRGIQNATFEVADAHRLPIADGEFDFVIVNGLLHHLNLELALPEIGRVMKAKGQLCAREPLGTNPLFSLYRAATPAVRTADERPFTFSDLALLKRYFHTRDVNYFGFSSICSAFFHRESLRTALTKCDSVLAKTPLKYFFLAVLWIFRKTITSERQP